MAGPDFGKQIGPLPLGAWVAVVAGGLGIAYYTRKSGAKPVPVVVEDTSGTPGVGAGASGFINASPITVDNSPAAPATNEEWAVKAINYLIAKGYDPNVADSGIRKYLEATQLSLAEYALVRIALASLGSPPVPLPAPPPPPDPPAPPITPVTPPPPAPVQPPTQTVALRYVVVRGGDSLWKIAYRYYGRGEAWHDIYNANRKGYTRPDGSAGYISNPNYLRPGDVLWVPGLGGPIR